MPHDFAKAIGAGFRDKDRLTTQVTRHLLKPVDSGRRHGYLHPSALSHEFFCPRAAYFDITGAEADPDLRNLAFEMVFERGHDSHHKWQNWFWEMGLLRGTWICKVCWLWWEDVSPHYCPRCDHGRATIEYAEVPVFNEEYGIKGQADGDVWKLDHWTLIEVKTIGLGTIRYDAPKLLTKYSYVHVDDEGKEHTGIDLELLWRELRRPFAAHLKQGMIYCFCHDRKEIVFLYEPKFLTAFPKEFEISFQMHFIEDVLEECKTVRTHVDLGRPPKHPHWAEETHKRCKECNFRSVCYGK